MGPIAVVLAVTCWALDSIVARPLADRDAARVVAAKSAIGATASAVFAVVRGEPLPTLASGLALVIAGAFGYGLSLRLYLLAQRRMGAARTASVFATAPFVGAALACAIGASTPTLRLALAGVAFALGAVLHATERHEHPHVHEPVVHDHPHRHDDGHHDHVHDPMPAGEHAHPHEHGRLAHAHPHADDVHHGHRHG